MNVVLNLFHLFRLCFSLENAGHEGAAGRVGHGPRGAGGHGGPRARRLRLHGAGA